MTQQSTGIADLATARAAGPDRACETVIDDKSPVDWNALIDALGAGVTLTLESGSGRRAVVLAEADYLQLTRQSRRSQASGIRLTERERELLLLIEDGRSGSEIATQLGLAVNTVAQHLAAARRKLGVRSSNEAARIAREAGILEL